MNVARTTVARLAAQHSLFWLLAANVVGLWLAATLLWPALGDLVAPFTYGRWMPLHLNWQLYGWCALPLVAALLHWFLDRADARAVAQARFALGAWSLALLLGGAAWLAGDTSGKLFLDWHGMTRGVLPVAMLGLWSVLAAHTWRRRETLGRADLLVRGGALLGLLTVPPVLYLSSGRDYYPAVNPDSGGATGAALLGSTLGIVTLFGLLPFMLGRRRSEPARWFWIALIASWGMFAGMRHGSVSHHRADQIIGLGLLLAWVPLLPFYWRRFDWSVGGRRWLWAAWTWWLLLVVTGWLTFLPGLSERLKFTNGLVAHAHLAMAGLVTAVNALVLHTLGGGLSRRPAFVLWQTGCAAQVGLLLALGWVENASAGALFRSEAWTQFIYGGRLVAGLAMAVASGLWLKEAWR
jgi:cytochrome c oxidase cbb3-type subunit 1